MLRLIFKGIENKEMFKGTEIYQSDYDWHAYTLLHFDFDNLNHERGQFASQLMRQIVDMENVFHIRPKLTSFCNELDNLVQQTYMSSQEEVVILVDNYDAPIVKCLPDNSDVAVENFAILREFFSCLISLDVYLRFAFVTGVSRFPMDKEGLGMNEFMDATLYENYTAIMEFTKEEMETYFERYYENATAEEAVLREKSYGYSFSCNNVSSYHSDSVVRYFGRDNTTDILKLAEHVLNAFRKSPYSVFTMHNISEANLILSDFKKFNSRDVLPMLFQTGYLTIKHCIMRETKRGGQCYLYDLGFATARIENYFLNTVLEDIILRESITEEGGYSILRQYVLDRNLSAFLETTNVYLKRVNYRGQDERIYRNLIECLLRLAGLKAVWRQRLDRTNFVQVDCIFELTKDRDADDALRTMVSKDNELSITDVRFKGGVVIGLNFDSKVLTIDGCEATWFDENNKKVGYEYFHKLVFVRSGVQRVMGE